MRWAPVERRRISSTSATPSALSSTTTPRPSVGSAWRVTRAARWRRLRRWSSAPECRPACAAAEGEGSNGSPTLKFLQNGAFWISLPTAFSGTSPDERALTLALRRRGSCRGHPTVAGRPTLLADRTRKRFAGSPPPRVRRPPAVRAPRRALQPPAPSLQAPARRESARHAVACAPLGHSGVMVGACTIAIRMRALRRISNGLGRRPRRTCEDG